MFLSINDVVQGFGIDQCGGKTGSVYYFECAKVNGPAMSTARHGLCRSQQVNVAEPQHFTELATYDKVNFGRIRVVRVYCAPTGVFNFRAHGRFPCHHGLFDGQSMITNPR